MSSPQVPQQPASRSSSAGKVGVVVGYIVLRLLLLVVLTAVIWGAASLVKLQMPVLVAAMLAVAAGLPLGWLLFGRQRLAATEVLEQRAGERRRTREELHRALEGGPAGSSPAANADQGDVEPTEQPQRQEPANGA